MTRYISAKEFRNRLPVLAEDLKRWGEIVILRRSKPLCKVVPFNEATSDLLDRASENHDPSQPDLQEISRIVHEIRKSS